ncbi:MAG: hypothetical protein KGH99_05630 [Thaumarchaeota archaeon]|nr:hypothetical protein [Nitrososphaerota archaeon]
MVKPCWNYFVTVGCNAYMKGRRLIIDRKDGTVMSKTKFSSPPLSKEEIRDVEQARKDKGKLFNTPEEFIEDLHKNVANSKKKQV